MDDDNPRILQYEVEIQSPNLIDLLTDVIGEYENTSLIIFGLVNVYLGA
jgi:hypothetical protein